MEFSIATRVGKVGLSRCTNNSSITSADVLLFVAPKSIHQSTLSVVLVAPSCEQDS
jgi:hypothetical protein